MALQFDLTVSGSKQLLGRMESLRRRGERSTFEAMEDFAYKILDRAKNEFVPQDSTDLLESGGVEMEKGTGFNCTATIYFGRTGDAAAYALAVHEHLSEHSPPSWVTETGEDKGINWTIPGTGPKYLETPFREEATRLPAVMAAVGL